MNAAPIRPIVEASAVSLTYRTPRGPIHAVESVSLAVVPGECVALLGRSGSGKSTLLALLAGLCRPTGGEVRFDGTRWSDRRAADADAVRSRRIGLMLQEGGLLPGLRALDNVLLPAVLAGMGRAAASRRAEELLSAVGLGDRWDAHPSELSGGQKRRVLLARALVARPGVLFADEPTSDLDGLAAEEIARLFVSIRAERKTALVLVTHDPALAAIADRRFWIEGGRCMPFDGHAPAPVAAAVPAFAADGRAAPAPVPGSDAVPAIDVPRFEPAPALLAPAAPTSGVARAVRAWVPFATGAAAAVAVVALVDGIVKLRQDDVVEAIREKRRLAEEMAMQDLRADVDDVVVDAGGQATVTVYLQNFRADRPLHVLGPALDVSVQRKGRWDGMPAEVDAGTPSAVRTVGADRSTVTLRFTPPEGAYDELLAGYLHVRIGAAMVVSDRADGGGDLFERQDSYYLYLRDPRRTEEQIRRANGWGEKSSVPIWIAMPAH